MSGQQPEKPCCFLEIVSNGTLHNGKYDTSKNDLIREFYSPVLRCANSFDRTTGAFTVSGIKELSQSLMPFFRNVLERDSREPAVRIISSHDITEFDYDEIVRGYRARSVDPEERLVAILEQLKASSDQELIEAIRRIATMVEAGLIEIRIGITKGKLDGLFHEKTQVFQDSDGHLITTEGSGNLTYHSLSGEENYESFSAFCSSSPDIESYKVQHQQNFESLWSNAVADVEVRPLSEYPRELLARFAVPMEQIRKELGIREKPGIRVPRECQRLALEAWIRNGRRGILDMCTGSGKTDVALMAGESCGKPVLTAVICGTLVDLIDQWSDNIISRYGRSGVEVLKISARHGQAYELRDQLKEIILDFNSGYFDNEQKRVYVLAVMQTASSEWFVDLVNRVKKDRLLVVMDEVHHAGSPEFSRSLEIRGEYRVGLSATWNRFDDDENLKLENYFRGTSASVPYHFSLKEAIEAIPPLLSKYQYLIHVVVLEPQDAEEIRERLIEVDRVLKEINPSLSLSMGDRVYELTPERNWKGLREKTNALRDVLSKAFGRAMAKTDLAVKIVNEEYQWLKKCIIYCNSKDHLDRTSALMKTYDRTMYPYDSNVDPEERRTIRAEFGKPYNGRPLFIGAIKCLDEGLDLPALDSAILVSSNRTEREWIQRRGRILRTSGGKENAIIHDVLMLPAPSRYLTKAEMDFIESELSRVESFGRDAMNVSEILSELTRLRSNYGL
jgi:superfamily II DNA or RNA helicase